MEGAVVGVVGGVCDVYSESEVDIVPLVVV